MLPIELWILILYVQLISQFETSNSFPLKYMISAKHFFLLKSRSSLVVWPVATQAEGRKFDSRARKHVSFSELCANSHSIFTRALTWKEKFRNPSVKIFMCVWSSQLAFSSHRHYDICFLIRVPFISFTMFVREIRFDSVDWRHKNAGCVFSNIIRFDS